MSDDADHTDRTGPSDPATPATPANTDDRLTGRARSELAALDDEALLAALGDAVGAEADDELRRSAARAAFTWRGVDVELAELLHDSALDAGAAVRAVGTAGRRTLSFGWDGLTLELEIADGELIGEVLGDTAGTTQPGEPVTVRVQRPGAADREAVVDAAGFFRVPEVGTGPTRFQVRAGTVLLTTGWTTL